MKATGIIRRIDELGRIVIPKEIRKKLKINEGENIEIFIDDEEQIILKKYSTMKNLKDFSQKITDSIYSSFKNNVLITDMDNVIASSGSYKKTLLNKEISTYLNKLINTRENIYSKNRGEIELIKDLKLNCSYIINVIISNGDVNGLIILFSEDGDLKDSDLKMINTVSNFLSRYLEQ